MHRIYQKYYSTWNISCSTNCQHDCRSFTFNFTGKYGANNNYYCTKCTNFYPNFIVNSWICCSNYSILCIFNSKNSLLKRNPIMNKHKNHPFHLVDIRPWPILGALRAIITIIGLIKWFHLYNNNLFFLGFTITRIIIYQWWRDVVREGTFQGLHTYNVTIGLRWGIILFITSEIFFFKFLLKIFP